MADVSYGLRTIKQHLLQQSEMNLGSSKLIPRPRTDNNPESGDIIRLLDLNCEGENARNVIITLGQFISDGIITSAQQNSITGPITGIVEWGNGGTFARVEFDVPQVSRIPCDPFFTDTSNYPRSLVKSPRQSGVTLTVAASSVRVMARNDNNTLGTAETWGQPGVAIIGSQLPTAIDPNVFAHVAYGTSPGSGNGLLRKSVVLTTGSSAFNMSCGIPPFAKAVHIFRVGGSADFNTCTAAPAVMVEFESNAFNSLLTNYPIGCVQLPWNSLGPLAVPPGAAILNIHLLDPLVQAYRVVAVFDLAV